MPEKLNDITTKIHHIDHIQSSPPSPHNNHYHHRTLQVGVLLLRRLLGHLGIVGVEDDALHGTEDGPVVAQGEDRVDLGVDQVVSATSES